MTETTPASKGNKKINRKTRISSELAEMRRQTKILTEIKDILDNMWRERLPE